MWKDSFGRVNLGLFTKDNILLFTDNCITHYNTELQKLLSKENTPTWNNTFHRLEKITSGLDNFLTGIDFLREIGKFSIKDIEFKQSKDKITNFINALYFNRRIAMKLHELKKLTTLNGKQKEILDSTIQDFSKSFHNVKKQKNIKNIHSKINNFEIEFLMNISKSKKERFILFNDLKDFENLPANFIEQGKQNVINNNLNSLYAFSLENNSYRLLMTYCTNRVTRKYIYQTYVNLASGQHTNNSKTLKQLIAWRSKLAHYSGYDTYTDYSTSGAGLDNAKKINNFLNSVKSHIEPQVKEHDKILNSFVKQNYGIAKIFAWDKYYINNKIYKDLYHKYDLNGIKVNFNLALEKMFFLAKELFNIKFTSIKMPTWDDKNLCFEVTDNENKILGHLIFDVFSRSEKPSELIYQYTINPRRVFSNKHQPSMQAIIMHLQDSPFIDIDDTITLFHEFGHSLHVLITEKKYHQHSPFTIEYDAMEWPSQWFEKFAQSVDILKDISQQNGRKVSNLKLNTLLNVSKINDPSNYWNQTLHSQVDIYLNTKFKPNGKKTFHDVLAPIFSNYNDKLHKYNQFQNNQFEHFFMESCYYSYLWSEHMVHLFNNKMKNKPLAEQGKIIKKLLNNATEKSFVLEFEKMITKPHAGQLQFNFNNKLLKSY